MRTQKTEPAGQWDPLLIEKFSDWTGFTALANRLPVDVYPPYLYVGTFLFLSFGVVNTFVHIFTSYQHAFIENLYLIVIPIGLILSVTGIRYMRAGHEHTIEALRFEERVGVNDHHKQVFSLRTKIIVYLLGVLGFFIHLIANVGVDQLVTNQGPLRALLGNLFFTPIGYLPIVVEGVMMYLSVHILLPRRLEEADLGVFFFDPKNMGGFEPVGNLLKYSYYFYTGGLILYLVFLYGPVIGPVAAAVPAEPGLTAAVFFTLMWLIGLLTLAYSMFKVHRIMAEEKEARLREIEDRLREAVDNPYDITSAEIVDEAEFEDIQILLEEVRGTSEYPTTFTMWVQIGISVLLPQVLRLVIEATL